MPTRQTTTTTDHARETIMKNSVAFILLFLFAVLAWNLSNYGGDMMFSVDGDDAGGPLGALLGVLFAGGGIVLAGVILLVVGAILALVFAGVGIVCMGALACAALVAALAVAPFLLPLLLPVAVVWYLASRSRRQRTVRGQAV
jgi:hypothetical protein